MRLLHRVSKLNDNKRENVYVFNRWGGCRHGMRLYGARLSYSRNYQSAHVWRSLPVSQLYSTYCSLAL